MVDSGLGVAVVPQSHAAHARRSVTRPLDGPLAFSRHLGLACDASDAPMLALLGRLADSLKASVIPQSSVA
jgi:DNA-binding transcriptional LysR family regulator